MDSAEIVGTRTSARVAYSERRDDDAVEALGRLRAAGRSVPSDVLLEGLALARLGRGEDLLRLADEQFELGATEAVAERMAATLSTSAAGEPGYDAVADRYARRLAQFAGGAPREAAPSVRPEPMRRAGAARRDKAGRPPKRRSSKALTGT